MYKISIKLVIFYKIILENNLTRTVYENLTVYEYPNFILGLKLQAETDILIIRWLRWNIQQTKEIHAPSTSFLFLIGAVSSFQPMKQPEHYQRYNSLLITSLKNLEILSGPLLWHITHLNKL